MFCVHIAECCVVAAAVIFRRILSVNSVEYDAVQMNS